MLRRSFKIINIHFTDFKFSLKKSRKSPDLEDRYIKAMVFLEFHFLTGLTSFKCFWDQVKPWNYVITNYRTFCFNLVLLALI